MLISVKQLSGIFENINTGKEIIMHCVIQARDYENLCMYRDIIAKHENLVIENIDYTENNIFFGSKDGRITESIFHAAIII